MEELHECIILMRSYFSRDNSDLSKEIEKALNNLRQHSINLQETRKIPSASDSNILQLISELETFWKENKSRKHGSGQLDEVIKKCHNLLARRTSDAAVRLTHLSAFEQMNHLFDVEILKMQLETSGRLAWHQEESKVFKAANERIQELTLKMADLRQQLKDERERSAQLRLTYERQLKKQAEKPANIKQLEEENSGLMAQMEQLRMEIAKLEDQIKSQARQTQDSEELQRLQTENQRIISENRQMEMKLDELHDELQLSRVYELQNQLNEANQKVQSLQNKLKRAVEDSERLQETVAEQQQRIQSLQLQIRSKYKIRFLPQMKKIGSHFNCIMHLLESMPEFVKAMNQNVQVCALIFKFVNYIRMNSDQLPQNSAQVLQDMIPFEIQGDNQANDFVFHIIDNLSRALLKPPNSPTSHIASIISAKDSPIYDLFFFLQRIFPIEQDIQANEVPLINSIKHVRYFEQIANDVTDFAGYLKKLIILEGTENGIQDINSPFNYLVFPTYLIFNVYELSSTFVPLTINQNLSGQDMSEGRVDVKYKLISLVHVSTTEKGPEYKITLQVEQDWIQIHYDQIERVELEAMLTFAKPWGDKELLVYELIKQNDQ